MDIQKYIKETNHWHNINKVKNKFLGKNRDEYLDKIFSNLTNRRVLALIGIRRSGKSTLMFQSINALIKKKVNPKKILYIKIDDFNDSIESFDEIINKYEEMYNFSVENDNCYIFVDEIQKLDNWQNQFKKYIDYKYNSIFIISGSSKSLIYKNATESLLGRISFINIFPLTFREFLQFNNIDVPKIKFSKKIDNIKELKNLIYNETQIIHYFNQYLKVGGFPEWFIIQDLELWRKSLKEEYIDLFLYRDIVNVYDIRNPSTLQKLFFYLIKNSGERFSYNKIAKNMDVDKNTIKNYLSYLENSGMILISDKISKSQKINERSEKKIYVWEEGLRRSVEFVDNNDFAYENLLVWHMQKLGLEYWPRFKPYYYHKKYEVDYVLALENTIIPIEIKNSSKNFNQKGLQLFLQNFKLKQGIIITKDYFNKSSNVLYIPLWLFLLYIA